MKQIELKYPKFKPKFKYFDANKITDTPINKKLYIGIELEYNFPKVVNRKRVLTNWKLLEPWWYATEDYSIIDPAEVFKVYKGLELVTHPFTYDWFLDNRYHFVQVCEVLQEYKASVNRNCGLHLHLSRMSFKNGDHIFRFQKMIYDHPEFSQKISGRSVKSLEAWATLNETQEELIEKSGKKFTINTDNQKFCAVNTCPHNTVELRIFKSSSDVTDIFMAVEYAVSLHNYTMNRKIVSLEKYYNWISTNRKSFPHLFEFMKTELGN